MKRAILALWLAPALAFSAEPLPARNLLVEWRVSEAVVDQRQSGVIVLRSDGSGTRAGASVETRSSEHTGDGVQRLLVLNGAVAQLQLTQSVPWQFVQAAWQGGAASSPRSGVVMGTQWTASGHGLQVQPRWPGGAAPVSVELQADAVAPLADGGSVREQLRTTLQLPLDQWAVVAERSGNGARQTLQLKISAP
ncbi:MAG TPA: hypothetical protein VGQ23_06805 [Burkholderiaceae bacterium]|nr:hypothetical protein [Burkholderiaceae bacterium]